MERYIKAIKDYSATAYHKMTREAQGVLHYPFIVPGACYAYELWDWDSWLTDIAIRQVLSDNGVSLDGYTEYERGCVLNFLDHVEPSGKTPIDILPTGPAFFHDGKLNSHKPCLAQHIAFIMKSGDNSYDWFEDRLPALELFFDFYLKKCRHEPTGLYFWLDDVAIGVDNDPCVFYRPDGSSASIYLNCLMYKELRAMEYILGVMGRDVSKYKNEADNLLVAIREHLWDDKCGFYFSADLNLNPIDTSEFLHSGMPRHWHSLIQRIDSWPGFMAMWAGIATPEQAERMVKENMQNPKSFWADYGIRSLSKQEKMYRIVKSGNPSCWLGPVWGISNYMCFVGLLKYGYEELARELCEKTITVFGRDILECGEMHEYYHPDTGEGVNNQGFQSWNLLVNNMIAWYEGREPVCEF